MTYENQDHRTSRYRISDRAGRYGVDRGAPSGCCKVIYDIDESPLSDVDKLPEWIANAIKGSESYQQKLEAAVGAPSDPAPGEFTELADEDVYGEGQLPF